MNKPKARKNDIVVQQLENETLVYDLTENRAFCLNQTSAFVWELCDGNKTAIEISDVMSKKLKAIVSEELVILALDQLGKDGLIENGTQDYLAGLSRREVIRKVGFASVIALPIVSSLVAPEAGAAQSCIGINMSCNVANQGSCCSGFCTQSAAPASCCVPGVVLNRVPGAALACQPVGTEANCVPSGPTECCSGTAVLAPSMGTNGCPANTTACVCS